MTVKIKENTCSIHNHNLKDRTKNNVETNSNCKSPNEDFLYQTNRPSKEEAMEAIQTIIRFIGDDCNRKDLNDTPRRVIDFYEDFFTGYNIDQKLLSKTFCNEEGYEEMVLLKDIKFISFCEHHFLPIEGEISIAYLPCNEILGISKICRIVSQCTKKLQRQERISVEITDYLNECVVNRGIAVSIKARHHCMIMRGVEKDPLTYTTHFTGEFKHSTDMKNQFLMQVGS